MSAPPPPSLAHEPHAIRALHERHTGAALAATQAQLAGLAVGALLVFILAVIVTVARHRARWRFHEPRAAEPLAATYLLPTLRDALTGGTYYRDAARTPFEKRAL